MKLKLLVSFLLFYSTIFALDFTLTTNVDAEVSFNSTKVNTISGQKQNVSVSGINPQTSVLISAISKNSRYEDSTFTTSLDKYFVQYPAWQSGKTYNKDAKVSHKGKTWKANWNNTDEPVSGLYLAWTEITEDLPVAVIINLSTKELPTDSAFIPVYSEVDVEIDVTSEVYNGKFTIAGKKLDTLILPLIKGNDTSTAIGGGGAAKKKAVPAKLVSQFGHHLITLSKNDYKNADIRLIGINGKVISTEKLSGINQTSLTIANVAAGIYVLNVKGINGSNFTSKIMHNGGDLRLAASFSGDFEIGGLVNSKTIRAAEMRAGGVDYKLNVSYGNAGTKTININAVGGLNKNMYVSFLPESFSQLMNEAQYNEFFPNRYGFGRAACAYSGANSDPDCSKGKPAVISAGDGDYDFFTYNSLLKAIDSLGQVEIDLEWACDNAGMPMGGYQKIEWTNKKTGIKRTFKMPADYDDWEKKIHIGKVDYADFCNANGGSLGDRKQELAAFLGNISHETTGYGAGDPYQRWGLFYREEEPWQKGGSGDTYIDGAHKIYPPTPGKTYHGRGPIQISWNYNYGQLSEFLYGDKKILLDNPDAICPAKPEDATLAFMAAIWFWMTPQAPKPSCHQVYAGTWNPTSEDKAKGRDKSKFGMTIFIINGGLECGGVTNSDYRVVDRIGFYKRYIQVLGETPESKCDCDNMK